ncbi:hypothetical protein HYR53_04225 [Candidatus Acetothermia bacterium]|nr:hypothetical protein [Candidatus Acetothermia bacterium]
MRMKTEYLLEEIDFLSPTFLLESHEIFAQGEGTFLDRGCVRLRSVPIPSKENRYGGFDWKIGDEYKLIVDRETGVLLYYSSIFEGEEMEICSAEEVIFDEVIPEIKFELNPTANQKVYLISD